MCNVISVKLFANRSIRIYLSCVFQQNPAEALLAEIYGTILVRFIWNLILLVVQWFEQASRKAGHDLMNWYLKSLRFILPESSPKWITMSLDIDYSAHENFAWICRNHPGMICSWVCSKHMGDMGNFWYYLIHNIHFLILG